MDDQNNSCEELYDPPFLWCLLVPSSSCIFDVRSPAKTLDIDIFLRADKSLTIPTTATSIRNMNTSSIDALALAAETRAECEEKARAQAGVDVVGNVFVTTPQSTAIRLPQSNAAVSAKEVSRHSSSAASKNNTRKPSFPDKLHCILSDRSLGHIITWLPSGKSFCIVNKEAFTKQVLPAFFKESKFESFSRRLKRWGFKKVYTSGRNQIVINHDLFVKGRLDLCKTMTGRADQSSQAQMVSQAAVSPKTEKDVLQQEVALAEQTLQAHKATTARAPKIHLEPKSTSPQIQLKLPRVSPSMTYAPEPMYPHHYGMGSINEMPMRNHAFQANHARSYWHLTAGAAPIHQGASDANALEQLSSLDQEIADCQEQLQILHRLRALREKRRALS